MNKITIVSLILSFIISHPARALEIIPTIEGVENPSKYLEQIICPNGAFDVQEARKFIYQLKSEIKGIHGIDLDLSWVVEEALRNLTNMGKFSPEEIDLAREFYTQILDESDQNIEIKTCDSWRWGKKKQKDKCKNNKKANDKELVLPDKMAGGLKMAAARPPR